jgi:hypothetical protein
LFVKKKKLVYSKADDRRRSLIARLYTNNVFDEKTATDCSVAIGI